MSEFRLLIDSDVFLLLAGSDLLDRAIEIMGFDPRKTLRLDPLPYMIGRKREIRETYPADFREKALAACDRILSITSHPDPDLMERLLDSENIDEGEAFLYAHLAGENTYLLVSGDKRAMRALCEATDLADIRKAVAGRVICLEDVLRILVQTDGIGAVVAALQPDRLKHKTVRIVFSSANSKNQTLCLEALKSYSDALKRELVPDFLHEP